MWRGERNSTFNSSSLYGEAVDGTSLSRQSKVSSQGEKERAPCAQEGSEAACSGTPDPTRDAKARKRAAAFALIKTQNNVRFRRGRNRFVRG